MKLFYNSCLKQLAAMHDRTGAIGRRSRPGLYRHSQTGGNLDATGSGSIDLTGLTFSGGFSSGPAALRPAVGYINTGPDDVCGPRLLHLVRTWGAGANQNFTLDIATAPEASTGR